MAPVPTTIVSAPQQVWGDGTARDCTVIFNDSDYETALPAYCNLLHRLRLHPVAFASEKHTVMVGRA